MSLIFEQWIEYASTGYAQGLRDLLDQNPNERQELLWTVNFRGDTALLMALEKSHPVLSMMDLVPEVVAVAASAKDQRTKALTLVVSQNLPVLLHKLIEAGAKVDEPINPDRGVYPVHAAIVDAPECLQVLIRSGANLNVLTKSGSTPLMVAVHMGNIDAVHSLVHAGADTGIKSQAGQTAYDMVKAFKDAKPGDQNVQACYEILHADFERQELSKLLPPHERSRRERRYL